MALNQQCMAAPGQTIGLRVEQPVEPGQPRLFWSGTAWTRDASARVLGFEDPTMPGVYHFWVPTDSTRTWPDKVYWLAATVPGSPTPVGHWPAYLQGGDDGTLMTPSVDLPWPDGRLIHFRGPYAKAR